MKILRITLLSNALFSLLSGLVLLLFYQSVSQWFGVDHKITFWVLGIGLLIFAYTVFIEVKKPEPIKVFAIIVQDLMWVIGSIVLLSFKPFGISLLGNQVIAIVAFMVFLFGVGQTIGLAQVDNHKEKGLKKIVVERIVNANKERTWKTVANVGNYHSVAPNIDSVEIISGEKEGMVRKCTHKADSWTEVATLWEEGETYSFKVNTEAHDYPYPLKYLTGNWLVEEVAENKTRIRMTFEFIYKRKIHNILIHPFLIKKFNKTCDELLDNWQKELEG